ncbi:MAG: membrane protein insertase YidC [Burkholderia sp.]|nr:membrane protein insertase YidC [Burkholderia sp.]
MDIKRTVLLVIFFMSAIMLYENWQNTYRLSLDTQTPVENNSLTNDNSNFSLPLSSVDSGSRASKSDIQRIPPTKAVHFSTDVYDGEIDIRGGTLTKLVLKTSRDNDRDNQPITLFEKNASHMYIARTGLFGGDFPNHNDVFVQSSGTTLLADNQDTLKIVFESPVKGGLKVIKTYTFSRGSYVIVVELKIINFGMIPISPTTYMELVRDSSSDEASMFSHTFLGPAVYSNQKHFQKIKFKDIDKKKADYVESANNGWVAMVQHYFAAAWIPQQGVTHKNYVEQVSPGIYRIGVQNFVDPIKPGQSTNIVARLFAGPEEERILSGIASGLELVKDYGWVAIIAKPLFWLLEKIYKLVGNWGWAIVMLTFLIKAIFFPLSALSYKSMERMKKIAPRVKELRERFKDDSNKMNTSLMELYKTEKVNPFGGCLPIVVQIPVFISLYWVLLASVEMRGAPWILWITDLSKRDPYFILPVLMAISMFIQTRLSPEPDDPVQAKIVTFMPLVFSSIFFFFPSGLVLYYLLNNILSIVQQYYISHSLNK